MQQVQSRLRRVRRTQYRPRQLGKSKEAEMAETNGGETSNFTDAAPMPPNQSDGVFKHFAMPAPFTLLAAYCPEPGGSGVASAN
jgi:hypothetical protein